MFAALGLLALLGVVIFSAAIASGVGAVASLARKCAEETILIVGYKGGLSGFPSSRGGGLI